MSKVTFKKIERKNIFVSDYKDMTSNNVIEFKKFNKKLFPNQGIAILYGPNGTGKTSLAKVLSCDEDSSYEIEIDGSILTHKDSIFHIIDDQNSRNIIKGKTEEFLLGDNIAKEYELKESIESGFKTLYKDVLQFKLKKEYKITKVGSNIISLVDNVQIRNYIRSIVNSQKSGKDIDKSNFIEITSDLKLVDIYYEGSEDEEKIQFIFENYSDNSSLLATLLSVDSDKIVKNTEVVQIEENTEAIKILEKFKYKSDCIVCDNNDFQREELIELKKANKQRVLDSLDPEVKKILEKVVNVVDQIGNDPFRIKEHILETISDGEIESFKSLEDEIKRCLILVGKTVTNCFVDCVPTDLKKYVQEYNKLLGKQPKIDEADVLLIQDIVSENIEKEIKITRDTENDNNFKIMLGDKPLLGEDRNNLELSNGEQNFISLAFELLKAKNVDNEYIVLDDPISSFDSIYKNKIAFCILKFLENKRQIVLTHNTDLIRLLQYQMKDCFNLYLFNNKEGEENGFLKVSTDEVSLLLDMSKLTSLLRDGIQSEIEDERLFLMSLIPFMRGYANIIGLSDVYSKLSKVMHGYETDSIDVADIYTKLFGNNVVFANKHAFSAIEICSLDMDNINVLKSDSKYPLLNRTLVHTLTYLFLRMIVEKRLMDLKNISLKEDSYLMLTDIIKKSFNKKEDKKHRVFFTSRKTLLNEFNHFEGNLNIFQPAIDITDTALLNERKKIENYLKELEAFETDIIETAEGIS